MRRYQEVTVRIGVGGGINVGICVLVQFREEPLGPIAMVITDRTHHGVMVLGERGKVRRPVAIDGMVDNDIFIVTESIDNGIGSGAVIGKEFEIMVPVIETEATGRDLTTRIGSGRAMKGGDQKRDKRGKYVEHC